MQKYVIKSRQKQSHITIQWKIK